MSKKKYFKKMLDDANTVIYDLEFKKFVAIEEREQIRKEYDNAQQALDHIHKLEKPTAEQKEQIKAVEKRVDDLKKELEATDAVILGGAPSEKLPDGAEGIDNKLAAWIQRRDYIQRYIKENC